MGPFDFFAASFQACGISGNLAGGWPPIPNFIAKVTGPFLTVGGVIPSNADRTFPISSSKGDGDRTLAHGAGLALDRQNGNRIRIDVLGNRIRVWFEDESLLDIVDGQMTQEIGGQRLDHGGIGFVGGFDAMFWIKDLSVRSLGTRRIDELRPND